MSVNRKMGSREQQDIHAAARSGDLIAVQSILASNPLLVNSRDKHSRAPLHLAAWAGQAQVVSYLCKQKADVGAAAMDDMGAIHFAAQKGHLEVVRTLLMSGVSVKAANRKGLTSLHYAVQGSHLDLVKYLVKKGSSLSAKTKAGKSPLDLASNEDIRLFLVECEKSLKQGNANVTEKDEKVGAKPSPQDGAENSGEEDTSVEPNEEHDEGVKRKSVEDDSHEAPPEPKKTRVALNHLLSADDTEEDAE
ncbi:ankyrin repeat family protein [Tripterygium wilfordii]|uniref:Ankyrin repeat family protein n=1 Tax=Tripterygium wilfordii TaxID=458696 RepID=A0A7J7DB24_TRIWF|nr:ankyrin-1 [Tripterygium wilfordii]KAF5743575.1 ankyrin repeat family protein [Tripterygium wilfordii]